MKRPDHPIWTIGSALLCAFGAWWFSEAHYESHWQVVVFGRLFAAWAVVFTIVAVLAWPRKPR